MYLYVLIEVQACLLTSTEMRTEISENYLRISDLGLKHSCLEGEHVNSVLNAMLGPFFQLCKEIT